MDWSRGEKEKGKVKKNYDWEVLKHGKDPQTFWNRWREMMERVMRIRMNLSNQRLKMNWSWEFLIEWMKHNYARDASKNDFPFWRTKNLGKKGDWRNNFLYQSVEGWIRWTKNSFISFLEKIIFLFSRLTSTMVSLFH